MVVKFLLLNPNSRRRLLIVGSLTPNIVDIPVVVKPKSRKYSNIIVVPLCYSAAVLDLH